jgi:hypothetical protein
MLNWVDMGADVVGGLTSGGPFIAFAAVRNTRLSADTSC